ncbi:hypothetical protein Fot_51163 [Forsythia ovata]|uniref:Uncharacterized protein n=1 Tax=Forsythia ovata TaxID=205694 RepID=A0ABD1PUN8_9LAMI
MALHVSCGPYTFEIKKKRRFPNRPFQLLCLCLCPKSPISAPAQAPAHCRVLVVSALKSHRSLLLPDAGDCVFGRKKNGDWLFNFFTPVAVKSAAAHCLVLADLTLLNSGRCCNGTPPSTLCSFFHFWSLSPCDLSAISVRFVLRFLVRNGSGLFCLVGICSLLLALAHRTAGFDHRSVTPSEINNSGNIFYCPNIRNGM